jgi:DNA-binding NarL/FixJ family response regulator
VLFSLREFVFPYLEKLKTNIQDPTQKTYLDIVESNLNDMVSPVNQKFSTKFSKLTSKEVQVANLVMQGKRTKQIAELLNVSPNTVNCHRDNIRKKTEIKNKGVNLRSYLLTQCH